jgi:2-polyprenyl-3-methyl-5-hydroxy-6-metoxy-1,4-benzoquinol methylase
MSEFDSRAREWDNDKVHLERSAAIAAELEKIIPAVRPLRALEYGAGTGILSFLLKERFSEIVLMDSSREMIRVSEEKKEFFKTPHIQPLFFDLEHDDYKGKFDMIYNQMVLHHVSDINLILRKYHSMLNPGGILAIADLYSEDGSFHGPGVNVHLGFDPLALIETLKKIGFNQGEYKTCFVVKRPTGIEYPVFLLTVVKMKNKKRP